MIKNIFLGLSSLVFITTSAFEKQQNNRVYFKINPYIKLIKVQNICLNKKAIVVYYKLLGIKKTYITQNLYSRSLLNTNSDLSKLGVSAIKVTIRYTDKNGYKRMFSKQTFKNDPFHIRNNIIYQTHINLENLPDIDITKKITVSVQPMVTKNSYVKISSQTAIFYVRKNLFFIEK